MSREEAKKVKCFVCEQTFTKGETTINRETMLHVCSSCKGTSAEKIAIDEAIDSLSDGWFCGGR